MQKFGSAKVLDTFYIQHSSTCTLFWGLDPTEQNIGASNSQQSTIWNATATSGNSPISVQNIPFTSNSYGTQMSSSVSQGNMQPNGSATTNVINGQLTGTTLPPGQPGYLPIYAGDRHTHSGRIQDVQTMDAPFFNSLGRKWIWHHNMYIYQ